MLAKENHVLQAQNELNLTGVFLSLVMISVKSAFPGAGAREKGVDVVFVA